MTSPAAWSSPAPLQPLHPRGPCPRAAHSCDLVGNKLFVFGGWDGNNALNDLHVLNFETSRWSQVELRGNAPTARNNHTIAMVGVNIYLHGGHNGTKWLNDIHILNTDTGKWSTPDVSGELPSARACHTMTRVGQKLYLFGGYDGKRCFNDIDVFDLDNSFWSRLQTFGTAPTARNAHSVTCVGSVLYMFGGHSGSKHLSDLHAFYVETNTWKQIDTCGPPPPALRGHTASAIGSKIFFFGGYDGRERSSTVFSLNLDGLEWDYPKIALKDSPAGRQRHTACLVGAKRLYVLGGFDGHKWLSDLHVLDVGMLEESTLTTKSKGTLLTNMKQLLNNEDMFPDIVFLVENRKVYGHKAILAVQCDVLRAMLTNGMKESSQDEIVIPEWTYDAFVAMMEFLYTGSIAKFNAGLALDLVGLADQYTLVGLKKLCENTLIRSMDTETVCAMLRCSDKYGCPSLKRHALDFVLGNFEKVMQTSGFESLAQDPQLLLEITKASMNVKRRS
eukprot:Stramenopile-MAST_4_protein_1940